MKRNINKRLLVIIGVGLFLVGLIAIWVTYFSEVRKQEALSEQLSTVETQTAEISIEDILSAQQIEEERIADLEEQIAVAQTLSSVPLITSSLFQDILTTANDTDVYISNINSNALSNESITGISYRTMTLDFSAAGSADKLYEFVDSVSHYFEIGVLKTLSINVQDNNATANMRLTVYSFKS